MENTNYFQIAVSLGPLIAKTDEIILTNIKNRYSDTLPVGGELINKFFFSFFLFSQYTHRSFAEQTGHSPFLWPFEHNGRQSQ